MFFGVPNLGINLGKLREITRGQLNNQLIVDLQLDSESEPTPYMKTLLGRFRSCHEKQDPPMRIISYYEEKMTDTLMVRLQAFLLFKQRLNSSLLTDKLTRSTKVAKYQGEGISVSW